MLEGLLVEGRAIDAVKDAYSTMQTSAVSDPRTMSGMEASSSGVASIGGLPASARPVNPRSFGAVSGGGDEVVRSVRRHHDCTQGHCRRGGGDDLEVG